MRLKLLFCSFLITSLISAKEYSFSELLKFGYDNSPILKSIEKDIEITKSMKREYFGKGLPSVEGNFNIQHQPKQYYPLSFDLSGASNLPNPNLDYMNPGFSNDTVILNYLGNILAPLSSIDASPKKNTIAMDVSLKQPIFAQGKVMTGLKIAKNYLTKLDYEYEEAKLTLAKDLKNGYNTVLLASQNLQISQDAVKLSEKTHALIKLKFESGKGKLLDTLNSQYELQQAYLKKREAEKNRQLALKNLFTIINMNEDIDNASLSGELREIEFSLTKDQAFSIMLEKNRSIKQIEKAQDLQTLQTTLAKSDYFPTIYCGGSIGKITQFNQGDDIEWYSDNKVFIGTTIELFSGGQRIQKIKQAKNEERKLHERKKDIINKLSLALTNYYEELAVAKEELNQVRDLKLLTEKAMKISQLSYETGQITYQELKDSEQKVNLSKLAYNSALFNMNSAVNNIYLLTADISLTAEE